MRHSRVAAFAATISLGAAGLALYGSGYFDRTVKDVAVSPPSIEMPKAKSQILAQDNSGGDQAESKQAGDDQAGGDDQGTELQQGEQQEEQDEQDPG